jgi:Tryptophan-associated transmembrane protein (Trp_oprn_chp)
VTARREFTAAIVACLVGAGLALLSLRQGWATVFYHAPSPLPSGSAAVTGWNILPAASGLAIAALACLAAVIATRGVARRVAGALMAVLGGWAAVVIASPVHAASVIGAAAGTNPAGGLGGSLPGGNSAISGNTSSGGSLPVIGTVTRVALSSGPWRVAALTGAVLLIGAGLLAAWRGPRWPVMSARFDRPGQQSGPRAAAAGAAPQAGPAPADGQPAGQQDQDGEPSAEREAAALWEALDRGMDLTDGTAPDGQQTTATGPPGPGGAAGEAGQPVAARGDEGHATG